MVLSLKRSVPTDMSENPALYLDSGAHITQNTCESGPSVERQEVGMDAMLPHFKFLSAMGVDWQDHLEYLRPQLAFFVRQSSSLTPEVCTHLVHVE